MALLTVPQYAKKRGVSYVAVTRAMNKGRKLIGIESYTKSGRDWFLTEMQPRCKNKYPKGLVIRK